MIKKLDKRDTATAIDFEPNEGELSLLSSNKGGIGSPSLDFSPNSSLVTEELLVDYLASILVEGYVAMKFNERSKEDGSDILPGLNQRAG